MKIFMTGATGFIGKAVLNELISHGHQVYALVRDPSRLSQLVIPIIGDLTRPQLGMSKLDYKLLLDIDIILHAGGPMNIQLDEVEAERTFLQPAKELVELAVQIHLGRGLKQFIHLVGFMSPFNEENALTTQDSILQHAPPYERSKFQADAYIRRALLKHNIPLSTVNPSVVIGDSVTGRTEQLGGLGILVDAVRRNLMPLVPGGDSFWLPLVHLDHVASFISSLVRTENIISDTYYLLDPRHSSPTMKELIQTLTAELRVSQPKGSLPPALLQAALGTGIGQRLGIPSESMNFIVNRDFPVGTKTKVEENHGFKNSLVRGTLP